MEFIITFLVFVVVIIAMAIGVIFGRKRLQGSCGGLANVSIEKSCDCATVCADHQTLYQIQEPEK